MGQVEAEGGGEVRRTRFDLHHLPALDGLRGVAVAGVLLYHGGHLTGGYLGVDLFFVLSGFLITTLLLREWRTTHGIGLRHFWNRRVRRLLPALIGVLLGVAVYARIWATPYELGGIRGDALGTLFYVANWRAVVSGTGYWDQYTAPSPLQHTWSLAIEEQLYLVWPLVVLGVLALVSRWVGRRAATGAGDDARSDEVAAANAAEAGPKAIVVVAALAALGSWGWMLWGSLRGVDTNRLYLGTEYRAGSVMAGAALAAWLAWRGWAAIDRDHMTRRVAVEAMSVVAIVGLAVAWVTVEGTSDALYRGVIPLCAIAVLIVILAAVHPARGPVAHVLSWRPFVALGLISYGLYLWHWPVFVVLRIQQQRLGLSEWTLFLAQVLVSLLLAWGSYLLIERPIRRDGLRAWGPVGARLLPAAAVLVVLLMVASTAGGRDQVDLAGGDPAAGTPSTLAALPKVLDEPSGTTVGSTASTTASTTVPAGRAALEAPIARPSGRAARLLVVGDSVGLYLAEGIEAQPDLQIQVGDRAMYRCTLARTQGPWQRPGAPPEWQSPDCQRWEQIWGDAVDTFRPDAVFVEFGGPPQGTFTIDGTPYEPCSDGFQRFWRGEIEAALDVLSARGATVYFAMTAHERFPWLPPDIDQRVDCVNNAFRAVAEAHPDRARVVRLDTWVCPNGKDCIEQIDGVTLREDGIHFRDEGARIAGRWVAEQIFVPAGSSTDGNESASSPHGAPAGQ